ncbi:hypothetical protein KKH56_01855 [bacterium]|nr:hypothetical protein [bacterium]
MANLSIVDVAKEIIDVCSKSKIVQNFAVDILDDVVLKIRVYLVNDMFIDTFYNADTLKVAYALIKKGERIFGTDNTGGWHIHPLDAPWEHQFCHPITFQEFLTIVEQENKI